VANYSAAHLINKARRAVARFMVGDGFVNDAANLGGGAYGMATNLLAAGTYEFDRLTLNQMLLRAAYRGSWIVAMACDALAEDMTKAGIDPDSELPPDRWKRIEKAAVETQLWPQLTEWLRWGRLFGGSILVPMIDGQDPATPLRLDTVGQGQLQGFDVYDRWRLVPDLSSRITTPGRWRGCPEFYTTVPDASGTPSIRIHYTRAIRFDASPLPHWERIGNMMWGMSIIERIFANIRAFDSTTTGAAQLALRAHLRTVKVPGLWDARAANAIAWNKIMSRFQEMRLLQSSEGITVLDKEEEMEHFTQTFAGLDGILTQLGQQVWGAIGIPEVRALRKSASGLNASDEWALNCYYDDNHTRQETTLREPVTLCYELLSRHALGEPLPDDFSFQFRHLSKQNP
jgi:phage-related protein (TIGR01555 family)